jgi:hypothetical protein
VGGLRYPSDGEYLPLRDSWSYTERQGGMSEEEEQQLQPARQLFDKPGSLLQIRAGLGGDWPDARGVFRSGDARLWAWVNHTDHLQLFCTAPSADVQNAFARLVGLTCSRPQ